MTGTWASGWQTGDVSHAVEFSRGWGAIFDTTLGGTAASIDITGIIGSYGHLMIWAYLRGDTASTLATLRMRLNGDTAANYDYQELQCSGVTVNPAEAFAVTSAEVGYVPAASAGANLFGTAVGFIPNYAGTVGNKAAVWLTAMKSGTSSTNMSNTVNGAFWRSSAAITRVTLLPGAGSFVAGSRVTVYAMGV